MENIIILLACVVMTTAAGNYKLFKMEKTEKVEVREFEMETKELDKMLSRKLYETRGNVTNCGMIYYCKYLAKIKITSW
jgi:hypothetical protein